MKRRRKFHQEIFSRLRQVRKNVIYGGSEDQKHAGPALSNQMPVQRSTSNLLENETDVHFKKTSKPGHISTKMHKHTLVAASTQDSESNIPMLQHEHLAPCSQDTTVHTQFVTLSSLDDILQSDSETEDNTQDPVPSNLFNELKMDSVTGLYYDNFAGQQDETIAEKHRDILNEELDNLSLLRRHTLFTQFDDDSEPDDSLDDSLVAQLTANIEALNLELDHDEESHGDELSYDHHMPDASEWYPHASKTLFALDWSNPFVHRYIRPYPETGGTISETWQAAKWLEEIELDELSPMWANWESAMDKHRHFYVRELAQTSDGSYVVLLRWVTMANVHQNAFQQLVLFTIYVISSQLLFTCLVIHPILPRIIIAISHHSKAPLIDNYPNTELPHHSEAPS
ncbi:hypothetical protein EDD85DRAFT_788038 [Armillaria nabsnona]|nr:hypothetical protein EDD85DRAFT_788038 [Armillaria nabsnona]